MHFLHGTEFIIVLFHSGYQNCIFMQKSYIEEDADIPELFTSLKCINHNLLVAFEYEMSVLF